LTPEELMRRYESGERDSDLLRQLNDLAWQGFHDPWELGPAPAAAEEVPATGPEWSPLESELDPPRPFTVDTIIRYLRNTGRPFWECGASIYTCTYDYDEASDRCCQVFFSVEGRDGGTFCARWTSDRRVQADHFPRAFRLCNEWNADWRWPRAFVDIPHRDPSREGRGGPPASGVLTLDYQLYLARRIHQGLFDSMLATVQETSWAFWKLAHREFNL
jgi:hypothetical protein